MAFVDIAKPESKQENSTPMPTATSLPTPQLIKVFIWVPPYLAETLGEALDDPLRALFVVDATTANIKIEVGDENIISQWVYVLVTPFSTTIQGVSKDDLLLQWQGQSAGPFAGQPILMDQNTYEMFSAVWGPAAPTTVSVMPQDDRIDYAWGHQPAWALVPFESLDARWKVLRSTIFHPFTTISSWIHIH